VAEVRLSLRARADLEDIDAYGAAEFGDVAADAYSRAFNEAFDLLRRYPEAGPSRPEYGKDIRALTQRRHRIFYLVQNGDVLVVRILHAAMDARRALVVTK
jgi:toxin ParE1/3/4